MTRARDEVRTINGNMSGNIYIYLRGGDYRITETLGDGGAHAQYAPGVEGICTNNTISNNVIYNVSTLPGFGGHSGIMTFFVDTATGGPTYGLHNDEGTAYIVENDNVLDIDPNVKHTINCEDFGEKHDLTIRRTYATVNKMGVDPPNSIFAVNLFWPVPIFQEKTRNIYLSVATIFSITTP